MAMTMRRRRTSPRAAAVHNVLVLCTGNSARSIIAEVLLHDLGAGRVHAHSAGSHPAGQVNPGALAKLAAERHATVGLRSKSWDEFSGSGAMPIDIVITVCDNAAGESCPLWSGSPVTVHWGIPDPAGFEDEAESRAAFDRAYSQLRRRVESMLALADLGDRAALQRVHEQALQQEALDA